ncbi:Protein CBG21492, partial [Caenorhabditis briggsae]
FLPENRTLTCQFGSKTDQCSLTAPDSKIQDLNLKINCKREPMDGKSGGKLRLACPIRCPKEYEVHVLNKIPSSNRKCIKYYTYGKYQGEHEW